MKINAAYKQTKMSVYKKDFLRNKTLYLLAVPVLLYYILFCYKPMYGALIAFQDFVPRKGISGSTWVGLDNFIEFWKNPYFSRVFINTLTISISTLIFSFPMPIILALLVNEVKNKTYKKIVQTISYLPHFISLVVICGLIKNFTSDTGIVSNLISFLSGRDPVTMLNKKELFVPVYVVSDIWQTTGWGSIIYIAALTGVPLDIYEAGEIDGVNLLQKIFYLTLPCIMPTIIVMLILRIGNMLNVGFEKIILLYNPAIYDTSDVISTFVYRKGIQERGYSFSAAVGLFNSIINFGLLLAANTISKRTNSTSLW